MTQTTIRPFRSVAIIGLGLMGGSLARALKRQPSAPHVSAADPDPEARSLAHSIGAADRVYPVSTDAVVDCDLIIYATSFNIVLEAMIRDRSAWDKDALVTDLTGVKVPVLARMRELGEARRYVGSHPMAGDHRSGFPASRAELYEGARVWLVRGDAEAALGERVAAFWGTVGGQPAWLGAEEHDELMAWVSHAPQLLANALAGALLERGVPAERLGPGGRDMTRLAASPPAMWAEILRVNAARVADVLEVLVRELAWLRDALDRGDVGGIQARMERTRAWRGGG